jgi:NDP-sugar pyrophosphorylase family protein
MFFREEITLHHEVTNVVVPMAGRGSRFSEAGYVLPKPLIDVAGAPMISRVVDNLRPNNNSHRFVFLVLQEHLDSYPVRELLESTCTDCEIVPINSVTRGAAETVLAAEPYVSNGPLVIANSDQWVDADLTHFYDQVQIKDGVILTMTSSDPKWSYVEREDGDITRVIEKEVVSDEATVGIYGYRKPSFFFDAAREMILKGELSQGEFYVAPTYTYMIRDKRSVDTISIGSEADGMWGLGIPDDLDIFLASEHGMRFRQ